MPRIPPTDAQRQSWRNFLVNHRDGIAAMDFFVVPTVTFRLLYGFHITHHGRRLLMRFDVTFHPNSAWVIHVVVFGEQHLRRLGNDYISYYNVDRCHTTLGGDSPDGRPV